VHQWFGLFTKIGQTDSDLSVQSVRMFEAFCRRPAGEDHGGVPAQIHHV
jgi:hypothetical protein